MIEYLPWSQKTLNESLVSYRSGFLSILDVELSGQCNLSCIYCDSPNRKAPLRTTINDISALIKDSRISWLFVCGLGEPLFDDNKIKFLKILDLCSTYNVKCSIFTNGLGIDDEILKYVDDDILYLLVKLDTFALDKVSKIYRTKKGETIISNLINIVGHVKVTDDNRTNIAASIVPTKYNGNELVEIINYCLNNRVFPLIGVLEKAGFAEYQYNKINITRDDLQKSYDFWEEVTGEKYIMPICPSVVNGVHINNNSDIVVDESTGLSCSWFWLKKPKTKVACSFNSSVTLDDIWKQVISYRNSKLPGIHKFISGDSNLPVGGCGGDTHQLLSKYYEIQKQIKS